MADFVEMRIMRSRTDLYGTLFGGIDVMKNSKSFGRYVIAVVLIGAVCAAALFIVGSRRDAERSYEYKSGRYQGYICGYVEAEEDDPMQVYIVFSYQDNANIFAMFGLPKERYEHLSDRIKAVIDNRETGAYLLLDIYQNRNERDRLGYDFIYLMTEVDIPHLPEKSISHVDLSWMEKGAK